ncbi:hypothetical protein MMC22_000580 [Lobaria immixta]|nr:hypothetical protein [Lobaria immixta]
MDPKEQCPDVMPNQYGKRFYPDGVEVPDLYDPSCFFTTEGNGNNESPTMLAELSSDDIDDNLSPDIFSSPT